MTEGKGMDLDRRRGGEVLAGIEGEETVLRIYCVRGENLFSIKRWGSSHFAVQTGLELTILLPQPSKYWNYKHAKS